MSLEWFPRPDRANFPGCVVAHFPNELSTSELNAQILGALSVLSENDLKMSLTILEPGKIRSRKNRPK